jgi:hypothetical protein
VACCHDFVSLIKTKKTMVTNISHKTIIRMEDEHSEPSKLAKQGLSKQKSRFDGLFPRFRGIPHRVEVRTAYRIPSEHVE